MENHATVYKKFMSLWAGNMSGRVKAKVLRKSVTAKTVSMAAIFLHSSESSFQLQYLKEPIPIWNGSAILYLKHT